MILCLSNNFNESATVSDTVTYIVVADSDPPKVTGGTVKNDAHIDAEVINSAAKIKVTFNEKVRCHITLQTFGGDDVGWLGGVVGNKGFLELVRGKEIDNGTLYMIVCVVRDAAGNKAEIKTLFHTKGVKRSVVEEPVVPEPTGSFIDDIAPILANKCALPGCHAGGPISANLNLHSYNGLKGGGTHSAVVIPGNRKGSLIVKRIDDRGMPLLKAGD